METVGPTELLIILAIALLVFGSARLPKIARSLGEAAHEFRRGTLHDASGDAESLAPEQPSAQKPGAENS
jgi:sec-independent protein translocase protein TatA